MTENLCKTPGAKSMDAAAGVTGGWQCPGFPSGVPLPLPGHRCPMQVNSFYPVLMTDDVAASEAFEAQYAPETLAAMKAR